METVEFEKHDIIIRQAAIGNKLYIIESGDVATHDFKKALRITKKSSTSFFEISQAGNSILLSIHLLASSACCFSGSCL